MTVLRHGREIPSSIEEINNSKVYRVTFIPDGAGQYRIHVLQNRMEIKGKSTNSFFSIKNIKFPKRNNHEGQPFLKSEKSKTYNFQALPSFLTLPMPRLFLFTAKI